MIRNLRVIDEVYIFEDKRDKNYYNLENNKLPLNHELVLGEEIYLVVGDNGTGKSTFLRGIKQSAEREYNSLSNRTFRSEDKLPLFNDWKGNFDYHNFEHFFNLPVFEENLFKKYQSKNEKMLIQRVSRNISSMKNTDVVKILSNLENKFGTSKIETLNRMAYIVEAGVNIINTNYPQTLFQNYELQFTKENFDSVDYIDFSRAGVKKNFFNEDELMQEYKGKNEGEKVMMAFNDLIKVISRNPLFLLDEPTRSLSKENSLKIGNEIMNLPGQKFIATHDGNLINLFGKNSKTINFDKSPVEVDAGDF